MMNLNPNTLGTSTPGTGPCYHERHEDDCVLIKGYVIPRDLLGSQPEPVIDPSWLSSLATQQ